VILWRWYSRGYFDCQQFIANAVWQSRTVWSHHAFSPYILCDCFFTPQPVHRNDTI